MAAKTLANIITEVADRYGAYIQLTVTGGSTTTVIDTGDLMQPDDYWNGSYAYVLTDAGGASAAPEGEERPVTDFVQSSATATVSPAFTAAVASGDTVEMLPLQRAVIKRAINAAVRAAAETWLKQVKDITTITIAANDYDYTMPTACVRLLAVSYRDESTEHYMPVSHWRVVGTPGAQELHLESLWGLNAGDTLYLDYLALPSEFTTDASSLGLGEPAETEMVRFVTEYALGWLHERGASREAGDFREHITLAQLHFERAEQYRKQASHHRRSAAVRTERWSRAIG